MDNDPMDNDPMGNDQISDDPMNLPAHGNCTLATDFCGVGKA
jgi:hypothetical protein